MFEDSGKDPIFSESLIIDYLLFLSAVQYGVLFIGETETFLGSV